MCSGFIPNMYFGGLKGGGERQGHTSVYKWQVCPRLGQHPEEIKCCCANATNIINLCEDIHASLKAPYTVILSWFT